MIKKLSELANNCIRLTTPFEKMKGVMCKKNIDDTAYLFIFENERKIPIHMVGVFFQIDAIWLNKDYEIVDMKKNLKPFTLHIPHKGKAQYLIELPKGTIENHSLTLMSKIDINK